MNKEKLFNMISSAAYDAALDDEAEDMPTKVFLMAYESNGNGFLGAAIAGIASMGEGSDPVEAATHVIELILAGNADKLKERFDSGGFIPGFGPVSPGQDQVMVELSKYEEFEYSRAVMQSIAKSKKLNVNLSFCAAAFNVITKSQAGTIAIALGKMQAWSSLAAALKQNNEG